MLEARPNGSDRPACSTRRFAAASTSSSCATRSSREDELVRAAEPFRRACDAHGALFVLNDRPDLVERTGADGVHVGQGDAPLAEARRLVGAEPIVGLSATTAAELAGEPDYFGVGAIFGTPTKPESAAGGLDLVRAARDTLRMPWFAIGGIEAEGRGGRRHALPGIAVVRAIRDAADPEAAARTLRAQLPPSGVVVTQFGEVKLQQITGSRAHGRRSRSPYRRTHTRRTRILLRMSGKTAELVKESKKFGGPSEPIHVEHRQQALCAKGLSIR